MSICFDGSKIGIDGASIDAHDYYVECKLIDRLATTTIVHLSLQSVS